MTHPSPANADGKWIADLIRNEYDKAPNHYRMGDSWDDGAERIAAQIIERFGIRAQCVPDGWALVPKEPTPEMLHASTMQVPTWEDEASRRKWQAMLGAAPAFTSPESPTVTPSCGCVFCDIEGDLHEDATGFHHVVNGGRVPCTRGQP